MNNEEPKSRSAAEQVRLKHSIAILREVLNSVDIAIHLGGPIGSDLAQTVLTSASVLAMQVAKHDAFELYEQDQKNKG